MHHCVGFDLLTAQEAFEHFRGQLTVLKDCGFAGGGGTVE